ncbi:MAG: class I SAM-dependent methyltransferase [Myxococcota bacterium]
MNKIERQRRKMAFEALPERYDRARPRYPTGFFDEVIALCGLAPGDPVLEVGAGTGIATAPLLERDLVITAVEPGARMRAIGKAKFGDRVTWVATPYESVPAEGQFAAVIAAQSWHWIDPAIRHAHTRAMLHETGAVAIIQHRHRLDCPFRALSEPVYREVYGPRALPTHLPRTEAQALRDSPWFSSVEERDHHWVATYTADDLVDLVATHSDTLTLPEARRQHLLEGLRAVVERHGGTVPYHRTAQLVVGR